MSIFILEDNTLQATYLQSLIEEKMNSTSEIVYTQKKETKLVERILLNDDYNIYFLDINLHTNGEGGFEAATKIRQLDEKGMIVFISSHSELAFKSYKYLINAYTFIDKNDKLDIFKSDIYNCLDKYIENKRLSDDAEIVTIKTKSNIFKIQLSKICYFESIGMHRIALKGENFYKEFYSSLKEIEPLSPKFVRVHHSFIVNLDSALTVDKTNKDLIMINGDVVPISRKHCNKVYEILT